MQGRGLGGFAHSNCYSAHVLQGVEAACSHFSAHSSTDMTSTTAVQEAQQCNAEQAGKLQAAAQELAAAQQRFQAAQEHSLSSLQRLRTQGGEVQQAADAAAQAQQEVGFRFRV